MLNFATNFKCTAFTNFFTKLAEITHDALKLLSLAFEIINQRTKILLFIFIKTITNNAKPVF